MNRVMPLVFAALACALVCVPVSAEDPPKKLTAEDQREWTEKLDKLTETGTMAFRAGKLADARKSFEEAVEVATRLNPRQDQELLALCLMNLGGVACAQHDLVNAESLLSTSLGVLRRAYPKQDHSAIAANLNNLAFVYELKGNVADAERTYKEAAEMLVRLSRGRDHPDQATVLSNLGHVFQTQGKYLDAEEVFRTAYEMRRMIGPERNQLAVMLRGREWKPAIEPWLGRVRVLSPSLRLYPGDDPLALALCLSDLGGVLLARGKLPDAERYFRQASRLYRAIVESYALQKLEGEALTLLTSFPLARDGFLSVSRDLNASSESIFAELWASKGSLTRVYEQRHRAARAATDPQAAKVLAELADTRRRRAELLLAPATKDPATLAKRKEDIKTYENCIAELTRTLQPLLPAIDRAEKFAAAPPTELQKVLPPDAVAVDFVRFVHFEQDKDKPGKDGEKRTPRYLAFVVTRDKVVWVDLDTADNIEPAINAWREAITSGKEIPDAVPAKVRELVWEKVRKALPANPKTIYICPDQALCKVPFAALPGDKPGTVLLDDFALATIPHAPFLLDKLWPQDLIKHPPSNALVIGGVKYDDELAVPMPNAGVSRGDPLVKPGAKLGWSFLANTVGEANGFATAAANKKLPVTRLDGDKATTSAILSALPKAKYAHFATHGFFADPSFRGLFQLDERDYEMRGRERVGRAVNSPLLMTGLVFAGANNPKTPGRGILTGEQLIDLDLSGLDLAVLSACETGLGDVAGGEGTFGLQRAFHYAGTKNVVASLWKVPDQSTAALMGLFYTNLWDKDLSPMESLRQAQLEIYRNPDKIPELAKGFRGKFEEVMGAGGEAEIKPVGGKAHPLLWAAFTLSGPGR